MPKIANQKYAIDPKGGKTRKKVVNSGAPPITTKRTKNKNKASKAEPNIYQPQAPVVVSERDYQKLIETIENPRKSGNAPRNAGKTLEDYMMEEKK